jgi:hypothetical protein
MQDAKNSEPTFFPSVMPDVPFGIARPEQVIGLSGLEAIRAIPTGALPAPPMARTLQQWIEAADKGRAEFRGNPSKEYMNPMGLIHGGWARLSKQPRNIVTAENLSKRTVLEAINKLALRLLSLKSVEDVL